MRVSPPRRLEDLLAVLMTVGVALGILVSSHMPARSYSLEARQRAAVAADVISGSSRGTQGLVGSLYLAPLPTVLVIFLGLLPFVPATPALGAVVAAGATVFLALYVHRSWRAHGVPLTLRFPAMLCVLLLPPVVLSIQAGQTVMVLVTLAVCGAGAIVSWLQSPSLRHLSLAAIFLGAAVIARYQGIVFVAGAAVIVTAAVLVQRRGLRACEGTIITFLLPTAYVILLWIGGNWLILGSPLFFLKAAWGPPPFGADLRSLVEFDCPWLLLGVLGLFTLSVPLGAVLARAGGRGLPQKVAAGVAVLTLVGVARLGAIPTGLRTSSADPVQVVKLLDATHPNGTFIVTGYAGYEFVAAAGADPEHRWVHVMRLEPSGIGKVLDDYPGREVFLLVNAAQTRERWDEVGLRWETAGSRIPERFLFARQVGDWTVFEVLRSQG
jgi:hypothetical protein